MSPKLESADDGPGAKMLIYFHRSSDNLSFILFADDSNLFYSHPDPNVLLRTVHCELKKAAQ